MENLGGTWEKCNLFRQLHMTFLRLMCTLFKNSVSWTAVGKADRSCDRSNWVLGITKLYWWYPNLYLFKLWLHSRLHKVWAGADNRVIYGSLQRSAFMSCQSEVLRQKERKSLEITLNVLFIKSAKQVNIGGKPIVQV